MKYPGGKNAGGSFQRIINRIPPHETYIEPFGGSAAVLRYKRPARRRIVLDLDPDALAAIREAVPPGTELLCQDALSFLRWERGAPVDNLESCLRLEVSGIDRDDLGALRRRLKAKLAQVARGSSNLPAVAGVVCFGARVVLLEALETK